LKKNSWQKAKSSWQKAVGSWQKAKDSWQISLLANCFLPIANLYIKH